MPESAKNEIMEWNAMYNEMMGHRSNADTAAFPLMAKALALQQGGFIPMQTDPIWINDSIQAMDWESLH